MSETNSVNILGRISHFFIVNRSLSILLLVSILIFGLFSFWLTPKQYNPEIVRPAFAVSLQYEGAPVEEATDRLVYELVEKIRTVPGVDDIYTEVHDGASIATTVIFEVGYDATKAKLDLLSQIDQHKYLKTGLISEPQIQEINPETIPVMQIVFGSAELPIDEVRQNVIELAHTLGSIESVSEVAIHGGYTNSLVVELDPAKLAAAGISTAAVQQTLASSQVRTIVRGLPDTQTKTDVVVDAQVHTPAEVGSLVIQNDVRVRDVGTVYLGHAGERSYVLHQSAAGSGEVVVLSVAKVEGSSAPVVTAAVREQLTTLLGTSSYQQLSYEIVSDDGVTASAEIFGLTKNLLTSVAIVTIVLMLFLSVRSALVVLITIPVTLLIVFGLGFLFDQTINRITLFALILSLGLLVDSAIVVVENTYAHLREWRANNQSASRELVVARAVHEIGVGLLLSTVTSVIVFLPMGHITGMMGPYMGPIAFFVPVALIVSLLVAVVVTPFVAAHLIDADEKPNVLNRFFSELMEKVTNTYTHFLGRILDSQRLQRNLLRGALALFLISLIWPLFGLVHFQMLPKADRDQFYAYVDLPVEIHTETTRQTALAIADVIETDGAVTNIQLYVAEAPIIDFNGMFKGAQNRTGSHQATLRINLTPADERARSSTDIATDIRALLANELVETAPYIRLMEEPPGPPVRATLVAKVSAYTATTQQTASVRLASVIAKLDGVVDTDITIDEPVGRRTYYIDHESVAAHAVSIDAVLATISLLDAAVIATEFLGTNNGEFTPVILALNTNKHDTASAIASLSVPTTGGTLVPLQSLLSTETTLRPSAGYLEESTSVTYITGEVEGRSIVYVMIELMRQLIGNSNPNYTVTNWNLFGMELEDTMTQDIINVSWGGEWEMTLENFRDLGMAMGAALLLVYTVLVAQYNRFSTPAYILVTVPLGLVGILFGFLALDNLFGIYLTATALIGFIALIGIVVNNAIIFLEYVEQATTAGNSFRDALLAAGSARLRPIVLTSLTTVLGSITIAGDPVWSGLAWAIVFGLSLSTILTLVIYPTLLMYFTSYTTTDNS